VGFQTSQEASVSISHAEYQKESIFPLMKSRSPEFQGRTGTRRYLPSLPHILLKLIGAFSREPASLREVSHLLGMDAALSARLMGIVHSVDDGMPDRMTGIDDAVSRVGLRTVRNIVLSAAVSQTLHGGDKPTIPVQMKHFWRHALTCGILARSMAQKFSYRSPEEAYLSGLLHDVGKLVVNELDASGEQGSTAAHCEAGAEMFHQWNLPSFMADAVLYHHEPAERVLNALPLVKIVFVANVLCSNNPDDIETRYEIAEQVLGLSRRDAEACLSTAKEEVGQACKFLEIDFEPPLSADGLAAERDIQRELACTVRDMFLVQSTLQNGIEARDMESLTEVLVRGLQVLFDAPKILLFLYDQESDALVGKRSIGSNHQDDLVQELVIPVQKQKSVLSGCLLQQTPLDTFGHLREVELTILDRQILRFMDNAGMLCLPLAAHNTFIGAVALGADTAEDCPLFEDVSFLMKFVNQAASNMHAQKMRQTQAKFSESHPAAEPSDLARKVVHEVSNPLGIIKNYLRILGLKLTEDQTGQEEIRIINEEIDRVSGIVRKLSDFSKPSTQKKEFVDINALVSDLIKITHEPLLLQSNIKAHFSRESSLPPIISDKNGLKQVFINLIKNAVEAMSKGGNLYIQTRSVSDGQGGGLDTHSGARAKADYVEISVRDEGPGIPGAVKSRLFEPFVSSKGAGHAGLGLSIAHSIVKELNGTITCESDGKTGTTFKVVLPTEKRRTD
jgi:putative nucleotidyltransferase with HDIG domain